MATISLCMIVKNEEAVLARCLDSLAELMDEIIIVDTGSTDQTKSIARIYTNQVYDFPWCGDFSAARNFSFEKAAMDYIYAPDADEVLDKENQRRFALLKEALLPEVEIVQMWYLTPLEHNTVQNYSRELRPKLFKRLRRFTWIDPVHETVRTDPVVFDSDIEIQHLPQHNHSTRDFSIYEKHIQNKVPLSARIITMYAKELLKQADANDLKNALVFFETQYEQTSSQEAACVLARAYRLLGDSHHFMQICLKDMASYPCAEICRELGYYYQDKQDYEEAAFWFYNAVFETEAVIDISAKGRDSLQNLSACYLTMAEFSPKHRDEYMQLARDYHMKAAELTTL